MSIRRPRRPTPEPRSSDFTVGHVECPSCGNAIPVTVAYGDMCVHGDQIVVHPNLADLHAHAWACYMPPGGAS